MVAKNKSVQPVLKVAYWESEKKGFVNFGDYINRILLNYFGYEIVRHCADTENYLSNSGEVLFMAGSTLSNNYVCFKEKKLLSGDRVMREWDTVRINME